MKGITLTAIFSKASTTIDGGWILSFQINQDEAQALLQIAELRDELLQLAVIPVEYAQTDSDDEVDFIG